MPLGKPLRAFVPTEVKASVQRPRSLSAKPSPSSAGQYTNINLCQNANGNRLLSRLFALTLFESPRVTSSRRVRCERTIIPCLVAKLSKLETRSS